MLTYYLGAGASAGSLPTVGNFFGSNSSEYESNSKKLRFNLLKEVEDFIEKQGESSIGVRIGQAQVVKNVIKKIYATWSVDTHAKYLSNHGFDDEYRDLKNIVAAYLYTLETHPEVDKRYKLLFSALLEKVENGLPKFKRQLSIISWNYDVQVEKAISQISNSRNIEKIARIALNRPGVNEEFKSNGLALLKLNGTISAWMQGEKWIDDYPQTKENLVYLDTFFENLDRMEYNSRRQNPPAILYAWDSDATKIKGKIIDAAKETISKSKQIVIVGYSFPDFNYDVDLEIFKSISRGTKIYVQCNSAHEREFENTSIIRRLRDYLPKSPSVAIEAINDNSRFYIPPIPEAEKEFVIS